MIDAQYSTGVSRQGIEQALITAGLRLDELKPADLAPLEDFHTMGRIATHQLVDLLELNSDHHVLDAGSGVGGTARFVADTRDARVTAVDLTDEYCEIARWLNHLVGLDDRISVRQADVTALPFTDASFDAIFSQHVQMNIADKPRLYAEARRVLREDGRLALWDITSGDRDELDFPLPWADHPAQSHLAPPDQLRIFIESAGFAVDHWTDLTEQAADLMQAIVAAPHHPLGLHAFVANFETKAANLTAALADGRLRAIQGVARRV
ncbi:SAM-dependent methyltransferase [Mycobacterium sp. ACS1612]|uniref:class I SAM-dependent methyltransferase n=1 Tax=Mycobacterium sp. ACS1612 TaxID=1834117 RepID=UPI000800F2AA|nr:class I SAM-dependent methyltransferase [Mycobacterium sp. ACS1612]OBF31601.1 SAM-dependent methyltransferase [Mycobacterium sp. ACS1612]